MQPKPSSIPHKRQTGYYNLPEDAASYRRQTEKYNYATDQSNVFNPRGNVLPVDYYSQTQYNVDNVMDTNAFNHQMFDVPMQPPVYNYGYTDKPDVPLVYETKRQDNQPPKPDIDLSQSVFLKPEDVLTLNATREEEKEHKLNGGKNVDRKDVKASMNSIIANELGVHKNTLKNYLKHNGINISNVFRIAKKVEKKEENDEPDDKPIDNQLLITNASNWMHASFIPTKTKNQLDDLQELLKHSKKYEEAKLEARHSKYTDKDFPPSLASLKGFGERQDYSDSSLSKFIWLRPDKFFKGKPTVYDEINPDDIIQGNLGDCYLLAAISSIAMVPYRLERVFLTKKYNPQGIYVVALCINGIWEDVVCDDLFPCKPHSLKPAFNYSRDSKLWVMLLEKAWAKIHGGYLNIAAGLTREALRDLTGASAKTYFVEDGSEGLWRIIHQGFNRNFIMTAGSDNLSFGSDQFVSKIGLAGSHAYSLLGVYELARTKQGHVLINYRDRHKIPDDKKERVVKLRNPWARGEWKGAWNDKYSEWTPSLREALQIEDKEDGIFCMDYSNFCKYFSDVQVCYYHDAYKYSAIKVQSARDKKVYLKFELLQPGEYYFSLNQKNKRFFPKSSSYKYSPLSQIIGAINLEKQIEFIGSSTNQDKENWIPRKCKPGIYFVCVYTPWRSIVDECSFSVYGPGTCNISRIKKAELPNRFFEKLLLSHALSDKVTKLSKLSKSEVYYKRWDDRSGLGYLYFENRDKLYMADITVEILKAVNLELLEPYEGLRPNITLYPSDIKIIAYHPTGYPSSCDIRIISSWKPFNKPKEIATGNGAKFVREYKGKDVGIHLFIIKTKDFIVYQYVNKSQQFKLVEKLKFELTDCYLEGTTGNYIEIVVAPGDEKIVCIMKSPGAQTFAAQVKYVSYSIKHAR